MPTNFPRPGSTTPVPKLQYVIKVDGWNWMVGSGLYTDDVDALVRRQMMGGVIELLLSLVIIGGIVDTDEITTHYYSAADQTADFGSLPSSLTVTVSAVNTISGVGPTETTSA